MLKRAFKYACSVPAAGVVLLIAALPYPLGLLLVRALVRGFVRLQPRFRRVGQRNLAAAFPEKSPAEREQILNDSLDVFATNLHSLARVKKMPAEYLRSHSNIEEAAKYYNYVRAQSGDRGLVFISAHYGNFEMLFPFKGHYCGAGVGIIRLFELPLLDAVWNCRRQISGGVVVSRRGAFRDLLAAINEGKDGCLLFDQNVKRNHAVFSKLFGIQAATTRTPGLLASRTGAAILFGHITIVSPLGAEPVYRIYFEQIAHQDLIGIEPERQIQLVTDRLHAALEKQIRLDPKQWFWIHRRFKTRPEGEPETFYS